MDISADQARCKNLKNKAP